MAKASGKRTAKAASPQKQPVRKKKNITPISDEVKYQMIAEAAFYNSLNRAPFGGDSLEDWLLAEKQIEQQLH